MTIRKTGTAGDQHTSVETEEQPEGIRTTASRDRQPAADLTPAEREAIIRGEE